MGQGRGQEQGTQHRRRDVPADHLPPDQVEPAGQDQEGGSFAQATGLPPQPHVQQVRCLSHGLGDGDAPRQFGLDVAQRGRGTDAIDAGWDDAAEGDRPGLREPGASAPEQRVGQDPGGQGHREGHQQGDACHHGRVEQVHAEPAEDLLAEQDGEDRTQDPGPPGRPGRQGHGQQPAGQDGGAVAQGGQRALAADQEGEGLHGRAGTDRDGEQEDGWPSEEIEVENGGRHQGQDDHHHGLLYAGRRMGIGRADGCGRGHHASAGSSVRAWRAAGATPLVALAVLVAARAAAARSSRTRLASVRVLVCSCLARSRSLAFSIPFA